MTYQVTVAIARPGHAPYSVTREGPDSHSLQSVSDTLLQAVSDAQRHVGVEKTALAELVASRGTFQALSETLDEFEVGYSPNEGMLGLVQRVCRLGDEVRRLRLNADAVTTVVPEYQRIVHTLERQRNDAHEKISHHGEVINGVRRALNVSPETPDTELPRIVDELQDKVRDFHRVHKSMADTIREVRVALNVGQETFDSELGEIARAFRFGNADPHTQGRPCPAAITLREVADGLGLPVGVLTASGAQVARTAAEKIARRADRAVELDEKLNDALLELQSLGEFVADADGGPEPTSRDDLGRRLRLLLNNRASSASPEQLAQVLFVTAREVSKTRGSEPMPIIEKAGWDEAHPNRRMWWLEVASQALGQLRVVPSTSLLPVTPEELARAIHSAVMEYSNPDGDAVDESFEDAPPEWNDWRLRVSQSVLDRLPSFAAPKQQLPPVTPEQLAKAIHVAMGAVGKADGYSWARWEDSKPESRVKRTRIAEIALSELPQIARADAEADAQFAAHVDASQAELQHEVAALRDDLAHVEVERDELHDEKAAALSAFRTMSSKLGMSFGAADDVKAMAMLSLEAVSQLKRERDDLLVAGNDANDEMHSYRGMVMFVADTMGMSAEVVDDALKFGKALPGTRALMAALEETRGLHGFTPFGPGSVTEQAAVTIRQLLDLLSREKARPTINVCAPAPEDWMVKLTPVEPSATTMRMAAVRNGVRLDINGALCTVEFHYVGPLRQRPAGELLLPLVTAEQLAKAWLETPASTSPGMPWGEVHPEMREGFVEHAARVIEALSDPMWTDLARQSRKRGIAVDGFRQGEFFTADGVKARGFMLSDEQVREARLSAAMQDGDAKTISDVIGSLSGGRVNAVAGQGPLLEQLRKQGEQLLSWERKAERSRGHHKLIAESLGLGDFVSPARLAERAQELRDEVSRLQVGHDDFRRELSAALRCAPMTSDSALLAKARDAANTAWVHQFCGPNARGSAAAKALVREMAATLGLEPSAPQGGEWPWVHLLSRVAELVRDRQNVLSVVRDHCDDLREALQVKSVGWGELMADARSRATTLEETRRMLVDARRAVTERSEDLSRALGFNSGESWEDMIEFVTGRTSDHGAVMLERNAFAEIRRILGLREKAFPSLVVSSVRELKASWDVMEEWYPRVVEALGVTYDTTEDQNIPAAVGEALDKIGTLKSIKDSVIIPNGYAAEVRRIKDAVETLLEVAGVDLERDFARPDVVVQKAGDAAAILRSWPDVLRAVNAFQGEDIEQPDEVAPNLEDYAEVFYKADRRGSVTHAVETLLAAHRGGYARRVLAEVNKIVLAVGPIRVTPTVPNTWCYGPNSIDPDPGKRWHIGCGGEVLTFDGVDVCGDCKHEWTDEETVASEQGAAAFKALIELPEQPEAAAEEPERGDDS